MEHMINCQLLKVGSVLAFECRSNEKLQRDMERVLWPILCQLHGIHKILSGQFGLSRCLKQKQRSYGHPTNCGKSQLDTTWCPQAKVNAHMTVHADLDGECGPWQ